MKPIRIAGRGSKLALMQSNYIRGLLEDLDGGLEISVVKDPFIFMPLTDLEPRM